MSVYVDNMKAPYGRMFMSHMIADTHEELHEMADRIGVRLRWFQNKPGRPHYDICQQMRVRAIELGAIPVTTRELVRRLKNGR